MTDGAIVPRGEDTGTDAQVHEMPTKRKTAKAPAKKTTEGKKTVGKKTSAKKAAARKPRRSA
ncbi:hypothetical protein ABZ770_35605 [Streptomyces sp. NPDC006654]|uniref:hypothetical protein n=1 Tax=unclassified Streptomyces TaxID=2593676 RepID=UPI0033D25ED9